MTKNLVIFGTSELADVAHYYFRRDGNYNISAFTVDSKFISANEHNDLPLVPFEIVNKIYPPDDYYFFVAVGYSRINGLRKEKYKAAKDLGYRFASYISTQATLLNDGLIGENCFILEDNTVQPFASIGDNVILWSGNHIGHHSVIGDHCFITSHVVISGGVTVEESCFIGVNATLRDHITIGARCVIGAGALILDNTEPEGVYVGTASERAKVPSSRLRKI